MHWYVIHTKPRQEQRALLNLEQQGYECYLPMVTIEKLRKGVLSVAEEPLFARYLFIRLDVSLSGKGWGAIRSTPGVSRLVTFGTEPAKVDDRLIEALRAQKDALCSQPQRLFAQGERVLITDGPFVGIEAIYQMNDGESRAMVLIELLSKPTKLNISPSSLRKIS
ncbi:MAG: transcription/translation regulatory transformer protein RfaH [Methylobacter sp.]|nr:transcription/translation regulatory transformer protein RfaH [Methylobacter sp.]